MFKIISTALLSISLISVFGTIAQATPLPGDTLPDFQATTIAGETLTNESLADKLVVFEWSNHDCPFVKKHYKSGNMQATQKAVTEQGGVWITVVSSAPQKQGHINAYEAAALSADRNATPTHVILDETGSLGRLFAAKTTPHMYVAQNGTLAYAGAIDSIPSADIGDIQEADNYVLDAVSAINAGEKITISISKPYGCSVKY